METFDKTLWGNAAAVAPNNFKLLEMFASVDGYSSLSCLTGRRLRVRLVLPGLTTSEFSERTTQVNGHPLVSQIIPTVSYLVRNRWETSNDEPSHSSNKHVGQGEAFQAV